MADAYTPEQAHAAAALGARWMDHNCADWPNKVNLDRLEMTNGYQCILGQTAKCIIGEESRARYPGYVSVMTHLSIRSNGRTSNRKWEISHGFMIDSPDYTDYPNAQAHRQERDARWEMLTIAWQQIILARRARKSRRKQATT